MSNSTTHLDTISSGQAQKEVLANSLFDAASPAMLYGRRASTTAALTWGYYGGIISASGAPTAVENGAVTLAASTTNYVEANLDTGAVSVNQSGFTAGKLALYQIETSASSVTSYTDWRVLGGGASAPVTSVNGRTGDVALDAADVGADAAGVAATAVAVHASASDPHPQYLTQTEGDARYAASTAAGVTSVNSKTGAVTLTASDVGADAAGAATAAVTAHTGAADPHTQYALESTIGQAGGIASLGSDGKVPAAQLPAQSGGTVTSVGLTSSGLLFDVTGSPVTSAGTLTMSLKTQAANRFLAGPATGTDATPTMRALVAADMAAILAAVNVFNKNQSVAPVSLGSGVSPAIDASLSNNFKITLGANNTLVNPTNLTEGMVLNFAITQDATGSRTLAYGSLYKFPGGTAPALSTAANAKDFMSCYYDGSALLCQLNKGFA